MGFGTGASAGALGIGAPDHRDGGREHGLERRSDEAAVDVEPSGERAGELKGLSLGLLTRGGYRDLEVVSGDVLLRRGGDGDFGAVGSVAGVDDAALDEGDPVGQDAVEQGVDQDGGRRGVLRALEPQLSVPQEAGRRQREGSVPQRQPRVR